MLTSKHTVLMTNTTSLLITPNTKHSASCRMAFGRPKPDTGCPRCLELACGAKPRQGWGTSRTSVDQERAADITAHYNSHKHLSGGCGPVCTFGEW
jgi:hypothetical protein